jgi:hypothetical protein
MFVLALLASLTITVWPEGPAGPSHTHTLRCTAASRTSDCVALSRLERPFAPVPKDMACTQVYGGPEEALVRGTYRGRRIWARFNKRDGCQIARWKKHAFLFR